MLQMLLDSYFWKVSVVIGTPVEYINAYIVNTPFYLHLIIVFVTLKESGDKYQLLDCFWYNCSSLLAGFMGQSTIILQIGAIIEPHYCKFL